MTVNLDTVNVAYLGLLTHSMFLCFYFICFYASMFPCFIVSMILCSVSMLLCFYDSMLLCFYAGTVLEGVWGMEQPPLDRIIELNLNIKLDTS
jgi:hypothetical protein